MVELLKNVYDRQYILRLVRALLETGLKINQKKFMQKVMDSDWKKKGLKERTSHIRVCLYEVLPKDYLKALPILLEAGKDFGGYEGMFFSEYVEFYGLDHWEESISALEVLTTYSSSEFAIRSFIKRDPVRGMKVLEKWSQHNNAHVRRLSSEGCRPLLPWATQLKIFRLDPDPVVKIISNLICDESPYVKKSVANNLNDISKDHPELAIKVAKKWIKNKNPHTRWIVKHGLRTLLKKGEEKALALFNLNDHNHFDLEEVNLKTPLVILNEYLEFNFKLNVKETGNFRLEYAIYFLKKNKSYTKKVFKISEREILKGEYSIGKKHHWKKINTRTYYEGLHYLEIILNGKKIRTFPFLLWFKNSPYVTYMLLTENETIYTGVTTDFNRRYLEHSGKSRFKKGAKYTKANTPKYLLYLEKAENRSEAQKRESAIKKLSRKQKESLSWFNTIRDFLLPN